MIPNGLRRGHLAVSHGHTGFNGVGFPTDGEMRRVRSPRPFRMYVQESPPCVAALLGNVLSELKPRTRCVFSGSRNLIMAPSVAWSRSVAARGGGS